MCHENKIINATVYLTSRLAIIMMFVGYFLCMTEHIKESVLSMEIIVPLSIIMLAFDAFYWFRKKSKDVTKSST